MAAEKAPRPLLVNEKHIEADLGPSDLPLARAPRSKARNWRSTTLVILTLLIASYRLYSLSRPASVPLNCYQAPAHELSAVAKSIVEQDDRRSAAITRLQEATRIPTVSWEDFGPPEEDERWAHHIEFSAWTKRSFPNIFANAHLDTVSSFTHILTLNGSDAGLKPYILAGHHDVVAVINEEYWKHPPFAGHIDEEGIIWGRGVADDKGSLIAFLFAVETLLESGWRPTRTLILVSHQDEEVRGHWGSEKASKLLEERLGEGGALFLLDEGGQQVAEVYGQTWVRAGVSEKGYADLSLDVRIPGGHSDDPSSATSVSVLTELLAAYDASKRVQPDLYAEHPIARQAACYAQHGHGKDAKQMRALFKKGNIRGLRSFFPLNMQITTHTTTVLHAGQRNNIIPPLAQSITNHRPAIDASLASSNASLHKAIAPIIKKHGLKLGEQVLVEWREAEDAKRVSASSGAVWDLFVSAARSAVPGSLVTPTISMGYSDSRYYQRVAKSILQWSATNKPGNNAHGTDEHIYVDKYLQAIQFFVELVLSADALKGE